MASSEDFVKHMVELLADAGVITYKKMFGEYGVYCDGKYFACICDNQFFIKVTDAGQKIVRNPEMAPPYSGAKPCFLISELDDKELLCQLTDATCKALPETKPKSKKRQKQEEN